MSTAAGSGRPTSSLSAAELMAVLLARHLRMDWTDPGHRGNDRLIFSKGHASPLLYAMFKAAGFHVWVLCGDSEMAEGSMWEALDKAGHFGLANLTAIVDVNP
jgi:transketolase